MLRRVGSVLLGLFFVLVTPRETFAIWGWLEELSGPGPFTGREWPFEFLCWESLDAEIIRKEDLRSVWDDIKNSEEAASKKSFEEKADLLLRKASKHQRSKGDVSRSLFFCSQDKSAYRRRGYSRPAGQHVEWLKIAPQRTPEEKYPANNEAILKEIIGSAKEDKTSNEQKTKEEKPPQEYYLRHSWKPAATLAFNYARFRSYQNDLLDPGKTRDDEGQTTIQFFETILGFEILPSLEIGAGIGLTKVPHRNIPPGGIWCL